MRIVGIDHVQLAMPAGGEDDARAFYVDVLGLSEQTKPAHLAGRGGVWFARGGVKVHLGVDTDFHPARKAHPGFLVRGLDDITGCWETLEGLRYDPDCGNGRRDGDTDAGSIGEPVQRTRTAIRA